MNLDIVKDKIKAFEQKSNNDFSAQIIREFKSWFIHTENYLSGIELETCELNHKILDQERLIDLLIKVLVITGNADKLIQLQTMDQDKSELAVNFLFHANDRVNYNNLYAIATLLQLASDEGKQITDLKTLSDYARTGI